MSKAKQNTQSILSGFLAAMYLLLVLLVPSLHQHHISHDVSLTDFSKSEKQISKVSDSVTGNDCLACHFLSTNHSIEPQEFSYQFHTYTLEKSEVFTTSEIVSFQDKYSFQLRGPPSFQI